MKSKNADSVGSVTEWIEDLKSKDPEAQQKIWHRFVDRLVNFANRKLSGINSPVVDANDVANMAFYSLFEKTPDQFESLINRNDLWRILALMAERRAIDVIRRAMAQKNGNDRLLNESVLPVNKDGHRLSLDHFPNADATPDFILILNEEIEVRLDSLNDETLRCIAIEKMQGAKNQEIASKLAISLRSVERKLSLIRNIFSNIVE